MKVFVTGASGFVGQEVVRQLHEADYSIRILARNPNSRCVQVTMSRYRVEVHPGDILDAASLAGALTGVGAVVHLVGIISECGRSTFKSVHIRGTQEIVTAAQKAGVRRFVQMSALGTRPNAASRYHQSKWAAEELVRKSGLEFTIFRPSLIYGPQDEFVNLFAKIIRLSPVVPLMGSPRAQFQPISVEAVAEAVAKSLGEPRSIGHTYDLCGPESLTLSEIVSAIEDVLQRKRWKLRVPSWLARCQATSLELLYPHLLRRAPPLNRDQLVMLQEGNLGDARPANELFGLRSVSFREGIARYLGTDA